MASIQTRREKLKDFIYNEIRMRYAPDSILPFSDNKVLFDLVHPENKELPVSDIRNYQFMNPNIIRMSTQLLKHIPGSVTTENISFEHEITRSLLDELELTPTKEDLQKIRDKNIKLCVVGYGGAMINMLYNLYLWSIELSEVQLFDNIVIFEKDNIDFSNLPRIGKPVVLNQIMDLTQSPDPEVQNIKLLQKTFLIDNENLLVKKKKIIFFKEWLTEKYAQKINEKNYIFVGAPTLETRNMLSNYKFFFMGHGDHEVEISYQPRVTSGLVHETYGTIDIPVLLVNLQIATAAFIKILANDEMPQEPGVLFDFNMKEYMEEKGVLNV